MTISPSTPAKIQIEKIGRRYYLRGNTFAYKTILRDAGCTWDQEQQAWWTGKPAVAEQALSLIATAPAELRGAPTKLADGSWGVRVFASSGVEPGLTVHVSASSGKRWDAVVSQVERVDGNTTIVSTRSSADPTQSRSRGRCRAHGCTAPATTRGFCTRCAFDEFDD